MIREDWITRAATLVAAIFARLGPLPHQEIEMIAEEIKKACPFKPDTAYVEVFELPQEVFFPCFLPNGMGPCLTNTTTFETMCTHCQSIVIIRQLSAKVKEYESKPGPLLQCIECHNTESPAGAMARTYFNHGRCMHCGNYFKVVRA